MYICAHNFSILPEMQPSHNTAIYKRKKERELCFESYTLILKICTGEVYSNIRSTCKDGMVNALNLRYIEYLSEGKNFLASVRKDN